MRISDWSSDVCSSDLAIAKLTFEVPDFARFPALNLARQALQTGGAAPTILNAANEVAVDAFLKGRIGFLDITRIVEQTLARLISGPLDDLEAVRVADGEARRHAAHLVDPAGSGNVVRVQQRGSRKSVGEGKDVSGRCNRGGGRDIKK